MTKRELIDAMRDVPGNAQVRIGCWVTRSTGPDISDYEDIESDDAAERVETYDDDDGRPVVVIR